MLPADPSAFIVNLKSKVEPAKLATILGVNVSLVYQHAQAGRLPNPLIESTYIECIQEYINHYKKQNDYKIKKAELEVESKKSKFKASIEGFEDGMPPLLAAKTKQDIRLGIAKEAQLWQKAAIERGDYISKAEMTTLVEPFIMGIRQAMLAIALESPEVERQVDLIMENLSHVGDLLTEGAMQESKDLVQKIMNRDVDFSDIESDSDHEFHL